MTKELYDKAGVCEEYQALRAAGIKNEKAIELGQKCQETIDALTTYALKNSGKSFEVAQTRAILDSLMRDVSRMAVKQDAYGKDILLVYDRSLGKPVVVPRELYVKLAALEDHNRAIAAGLSKGLVRKEAEKAYRAYEDYVLTVPAASSGKDYDQKVYDFYEPSAVVQTPASGSKKSTPKKMAGSKVKTGINPRTKKPYYIVDGKFASKADYCAAGGKAKAAKCKTAEKAGKKAAKKKVSKK